MVKGLTELARKAALDNGFFVIELGKKASVDNVQEILELAHRRLNEIFVGMALEGVGL